jgi:hypothetical protein
MHRVLRFTGLVAACGLIHALAQAAPCSVVGTWTGQYGGSVTIDATLSGVTSYPNCAVHGTLSATMKADNSGFTAAGQYPTAACSANNFTSTSFDLNFAADCNSASGTATTTGNTVPDTWTLSKPVKITSPAANASFALTQSDNTASDPIEFSATSSVDANTPISWGLTLTYATSGNRGSTTLTRSFDTQTGASHNEQYASQGGKIAVKATQSSNSDSTTAYVVGTAVPNSAISARLLALYSGATPDLLKKIAMQESGYRQFATRTLLGLRALWPVESYDGGSHIGLMQVPVNIANAFDWMQNTQAGATVFTGMLQIALTRENQVRQANPGLPALNAVQRENNALAMYNTGSGVSNMYYAANASTQPPTWVVNPNNPNGVAYANSVRNQTPPN